MQRLPPLRSPPKNFPSNPKVIESPNPAKDLNALTNPQNLHSAPLKITKPNPSPPTINMGLSFQNNFSALIEEETLNPQTSIQDPQGQPSQGVAPIETSIPPTTQQTATLEQPSPPLVQSACVVLTTPPQEPVTTQASSPKG